MSGWTVGTMFVLWFSALAVPLFSVRRAQSFLGEEARREITVALVPCKVRLLVAWGAVFVAFSVWALLDWSAWVEGRRRGILSLGMLFGFHLLWWPFSMPLIVRHQRLARGLGELSSLGHDRPVRHARLVRRSVRNDLPPALLRLPGILCGIGVLGFLIRLFTLGNLDLSVGAPVGFVGAGLLVSLVHALWIRKEIEAPEALTGQGDAADEYAREVESLRRFRLRGISWLQAAMSLLFFTVAFLELEVAAGNLPAGVRGLVGGLGGSLVGLLGGGFGMFAGLRGTRLQSLKAKLDPGTSGVEPS